MSSVGTQGNPPLELKFGILGILFSIIGLILAILASERSQLVEVSLILPSGKFPIAEFGIFNSRIDTGSADQISLRDTGFLYESFNGKTEGFPILFPAQTGSVKDLLPVNVDFLRKLEVALESEDGIVTPTFEELSSALDTIGFDGCSEYFSTLPDILQLFHVELQRFIFPKISLLYSNRIATELEDFTVTPLIELIETDPIQLLLEGFLQEALEKVVEQPAERCPPISLETIITDRVGTCVSASLNRLQVPRLTGFIVSGLAGEFRGNCVDETVEECLKGIVSLPLDTSLPSLISFQNKSICDISRFCQETDTKEQFLFQLQSLLLENEDTRGAQLIQNYLSFFNDFGIVLRRSTFADGIQRIQVPVSFPIRESVSYSPSCDYVSALAQAKGVQVDSPCVFGNYWKRLAELTTAAELARSASEIGRLYDYCSENSNGLVTLCPSLTSFSFVDISFNRNIGIDQAAILQADIFYDSARFLCAKDEDDMKKLKTAQNTMKVALICYASSVIVGLFALTCSKYRVKLFAAACVAASFSHALTITTLVIMQNAPLYSEVGLPDPLEDPRKLTFSTGNVPLFCIGSSFSLFIAGLFYFIAAMLTRKRIFKDTFLEKSGLRFNEEQPTPTL